MAMRYSVHALWLDLVSPMRSSSANLTCGKVAMHALVYTSIYISVAAALLTGGTHRLLGVDGPSYPLMVLVFSATLLIYNLDRLVGSRREDLVDSTARHHWVRRHPRWLRILVVLGGLGVLGSLFFLRWTTIAALLPLAGLSLSYVLPLVVPKKTRTSTASQQPRPTPLNARGWRLKELPATKTFVIALVWAVVTVMLPALESDQPLWNSGVWMTFTERFIFVYALTLPFDCRDLLRDRTSGIRTLATILGARKTLAIAMGLMMVFIAMTGLRFDHHSDPALLAMSLTALLTLAALVPAYYRHRRPGADDVAPSKRPTAMPELYYVLLLDGMLLLQGMVLFALY